MCVCVCMCDLEFHKASRLKDNLIQDIYVYTYIMKGTKVLTLGAGREVLPHNMAVTKM